jgi:WD40 repeat protein
MALGSGSVRAGSLRAVWEVDLRKAIQGHGVVHDPDLPVWSLTFSPDGSQLAVVADQWLLGTKTTRAPYYDIDSGLFIIQAEHPAQSVRWYDDLLDRDRVQWSPGGALIFAAKTVIRLADGKRCGIPPAYAAAEGGFLSADKLAFDITLVPSASAKGDLLGSFGADCGLQEKWLVPGMWSVSDVSADRGLVLVNSKTHAPGEVVIVDPATKRELHRWPTTDSWEGWTVQLMAGAVFADSGKAICCGSEAETKKLPVSCWDVDTGEKIADAPNVRGGNPIEAAAQASRIVVSDYSRVRESLFSYEFGEKLKRMVVWDFRSGEEIASWHPGYQAYNDLGPVPPKHSKDLCPFAISPDGQYIAEGCNGVVRLYGIQP